LENVLRNRSLVFGFFFSETQNAEAERIGFCWLN